MSPKELGGPEISNAARYLSKEQEDSIDDGQASESREPGSWSEFEYSR